MKRNKRVGMDINALAVKVLEHYELPPDARLKEVLFDKKNKRLFFEFEHQTFDMVKTTPTVEDKGLVGSEKIGVKKKKK